MKRLIQCFAVVALLLSTTSAFAQTPDTVTVRTLNTYANLAGAPDVTSLIDSLQAHPYANEEVVFTATLVTFPKSSGLANTTVDGDGNVTDISRIHIFVIDTSATSMGRDGMSIQLVESNDDTWRALSALTRGDVVRFNATYSFFNAESQLGVESFERLGSVNDEFPQHADLLTPRKVSVDELNIANVDGTYQINIANYSKYNQEYVQIDTAVVSNVSLGTRPNWAVNNEGSRIYIYDTSLRYRNDRGTYFPGFNNRRAEDGEFVPPAPGATINLSGFIGFAGSGDDPDGNTASNQISWSIRPFEDGVLWNNDQRFVDGQDLGGGVIFEWPNDIELIGSPPLFSNIAISPEEPTADDQVTVSATVVPVGDGVTVTGVDMFYVAQGDTGMVTMTADGSTYSANIPAFPIATPVSYYFEAEDSEGLSVRNPITGNYTYLVAGSINTIAEIQTTANGFAGDSPLAGLGAIPSNITATVTAADGVHGYIAVQDAGAAWSGIFVNGGANVDSLEAGEVINITEFEVDETFGVTNLTINAFTNEGMNTMMDSLIVTGVTDSVIANYEPYEGVYLSFENVTVTTNQADGGNDFGEWSFTTNGGTSALRYDDRSSTFSSAFNEHFKIGAAIDELKGILYFSFGNPKMVGSPDDISGEDFTRPFTGFDLTAPNDGAAVVVTGDITPTWDPAFDVDGNEVTYEWVLYGTDTTQIVAVSSNSAGVDTAVTLGFDTVDGLLADVAGLAVGENADFLWNVRVIAGSDTVDVSTGYDIGTNSFTSLYYELNLERGVQSSNEDELGVPSAFVLEQNYPNPFNPSTNIEFALPQTSRVTLTVFDMLGRKVATLVDGQQMEAANHSVRFDASALASGMYIYRIEAGAFSSTRKMMLIK